ncbi:Protein of unknown function [Gryllus bimaculatus]|nr:Protein of unknown function [Gryllus bimaculatus]
MYFCGERKFMSCAGVCADLKSGQGLTLAPQLRSAQVCLSQDCILSENPRAFKKIFRFDMLSIKGSIGNNEYH